jgi:hypothetical protein
MYRDNIEHYRPRDDNPYEITAEKRLEMVSSLLEERPPVGEHSVVCYRLRGDDPFADIARSIECEVFHNEFDTDPEDPKNDPANMKIEYSPYEATSMFFLSIDRESENAIGALRVIKNSINYAEGFKTLDDVPAEYTRDFAQEYDVDDFSKVWDIGTVAVLREYRSQAGNVSGQLYAGMYATALSEQVKHFVSVIDTRVYTKMRDYLGIPFQPLYDMPEINYLNAQSQFVYGEVDTFLPSVRKKRRKLIFSKQVRDATAPLVGKANDALQFEDKIPK